MVLGNIVFDRTEQLRHQLDRLQTACVRAGMRACVRACVDVCWLCLDHLVGSYLVLVCKLLEPVGCQRACKSNHLKPILTLKILVHTISNNRRCGANSKSHKTRFSCQAAKLKPSMKPRSCFVSA